MAVLLPQGKQYYTTSTGAPLIGGKVYTYDFGTTNPRTTWQDAAGTQPNTNPVILDSRGEAIIYWSGNYKVVIKDSLDNTIWTVDGISTVLSSIAQNLLPAADNTYDIGSAALAWRQVYVGANHAPILDTVSGNLGYYKRTDAEIAAGVTPVYFSYPPGYLRRYGTLGVGADTAVFQLAINAARGAGGTRYVRLWPGDDVTITSSLILASDTLAPVDVIGAAPEWYGKTFSSRIQGNFNGPLFTSSGTAIAYSVGPTLADVRLENPNTGTSACLLSADYCGGLRTVFVWGRVGNIGFFSNQELISPRFIETCIDAPTGISVACYRLGTRNPIWYGGRAYSAQYGLDVSGDDPLFIGLNVEFCQVVFRHQALTGAVFLNCHLETSQVIVTNATVVPINVAGAWVDAGGTGVGTSTGVKFIGGQIALTNANSNLAVIKGSGGFNYVLEFDSVNVIATNLIVGNSFTPGAAVALPSGTKIIVKNITNLLVQKPPLDASSGYLFENTNAQGWVDTVGLKVGGNALNSAYNYTTYVPVWGSTAVAPAIGNGTITGRYWQDGNKVTALISVTMGATTGFGTGTYTFTLPVAASFTGFGCAKASDTGVANYIGIAYVNSGLCVVFNQASPSVLWGPANPFAFGATDTIEIEISYFV